MAFEGKEEFVAASVSRTDRLAEVKDGEAQMPRRGGVSPSAVSESERHGGGLEIERRFTRGVDDGCLDPYESVEWERRTSRILNADGSVVFESDDVEVPSSWSPIAGDIMASKYFRKAGVPLLDERGRPLKDEAGRVRTGAETSARQVVRRLTGCWRHWGEKHGYFSSTADAAVFEDELAYMLLHQMAAPNSPQWFNTGLSWAYGLTGPAQGHYYADPSTGKIQRSEDAYTRPQPHACFIQSIRDDLVNTGGIMDLWVREARLFKYGSGTGTNFSAIRGEGEPLGGGGFSSGLMSFLKIGDRAAGAIKSGGTTRRAAKMVCLDVDHPDIEAFVNWKAEEENKVAALINAGYSPDFNGEAYATVSGQNSNNSVRISESFFRALEQDGDWKLRWRTDGRVSKVIKTRELWDQICKAAWRCADPGIQYDTTINDWHTCSQSGRINASNPCSEYMFLDDTACNLASINLIKFYDPQTRSFDVDAFRHACRLWTMVLEISVLMAQYPSPKIAELSHRFRTLGLGYANIGTLLMVCGIPYDSEAGRAICGALTAIMTSESYATSAEMAGHLGAFPGYAENREGMLRVVRNHRRAVYDAEVEEYEGLSRTPRGIKEEHCPDYLLEAARAGWDRALRLGEQNGYRNAQTTVIAPTGTIGLLMDCDTTGIEPDFSLVKFKKLAGGGFFKIPNRSVSAALENLGYSAGEIEAMINYLVGTGTLDESSSCPVHRRDLQERGLEDEEIAAVEQALPRVFDLASAFSVWTVGEQCMERLGIAPESYQSPSFNLLRHLGYSAKDIDQANDHICGRHTLEGAPHLRPEHYSVFDCANRCGKLGKRFIAPAAHLRMMAAAQPFISGAISKTVNMPAETTVEEISKAYLLSWKLGLKATALYRDGCKQSQPLSTKSDADNAAEDAAEEVTGSEAVMEDMSLAETLAVEAVTVTEERLAEVSAATSSPAAAPASSAAPASQAAQAAQATPVLGPTPQSRRPLPLKRRGFTQEAKVGGHKIYLRTGEYEDGSLGEIFIDMHKEGAAFRGLMNCFAVAISKGLQYGVPLEEFIETFTFTRFAPHGQVQGHPNIKLATSVVDYVFRVLGLEYLRRTDLVHVKPASIQDGDPADRAHVEGDVETEGSAPAEEGRGGPESRDSSGPPLGAVPGVLSDKAGGNGNVPLVDVTSETVMVEYYNEQLSELMGDAPVCDKCGQITIRSGSCYRCLFCGESMGCS